MVNLSPLLWQYGPVAIGRCCLPAMLLAAWLPCAAQHSGFAPVPAVPASASQDRDEDAEAALQRGIVLTRQGKFAQAIPYLQQAQGHVAEAYAEEFNLGLAYLGASRYHDSLNVLTQLSQHNGETAAVENLLAQDHIGLHETQAAYLTAERAAMQAPQDEKLYAYLADACTDHAMAALGLRMVELGLTHLAGSARLHYERAVFLAELDRLPEARPAFARAFALDPQGYIGSLARVQALLYDDRFEEAADAARAALRAGTAPGGDRDSRLQALLGIVLVAQGVVPGQPAFVEAQQALVAAVTTQAADPTAQAALGTLLLRAGDAVGALQHLEAARRLQPGNRAVYPGLATAYRRLGQPARADQCMQQLAGLLQEQAAAAPAPVEP